MSQIQGKISQVIGPVVDVNFDKGMALPNIYDALEVRKADGTRVVLEVQSHVGENAIRAISMDSTDGFRRGMEVTSTGSAIKMPIGRKSRDVCSMWSVKRSTVSMWLTIQTECQFTVKHRNSISYPLQQKYFSQVSK